MRLNLAGWIDAGGTRALWRALTRERLLPLAVVLILGAGFLGGCSRERPASLAKKEGILLMGNGPEPAALDPHVTTGNAELHIEMALFEGLVTPDPETLEPEPGVAESWTVTEEGLVYTFTLREAARWSDGEPVTAEDFVAGWRRALSPEQGCPNAAMLYVLEGAESYNQGETKDPATVGVRALDERTLEARLVRHVPYFLQMLLHPVWSPVPAHQLSNNAGERTGSWTLPGSFTGNGAFVLTEWLPNQYVEVRRSETYWDAGTVMLEGVRFMAIDEPNAEERAFLAGQLHVTDALPPARVAAYRDQNVPELRIYPYLGTYYILLNHRNPALGDVKVRRALALAIDREAIAEKLLGAGQRAAGGFVPDNMPGYHPAIPVEYNPDQARYLLGEAGYPGGEGLPSLEYMFNSSESHRKIAEALQAMWRQELGIEIVLANQEWRTYLQRRESGDFEMARAVWIGDYIDPSTFLDLWTTSNPNNWAGWHDTSYDALLENALNTENKVNRMRGYALAERYLISEQVVIPLYHYVTVKLMDPAVQGWHGNILDWHPLKYVHFSD